MKATGLFRCGLLTAVIFISSPRPAPANEGVASRVIAIESAIATAARRPPDPRVVTSSARATLRSSIARTDEFLAASGAEIHRGWSAWLMLPDLKRELACAQPNVDVLRDISQRLESGQVGLELPAFISLRRSLAGYLAALEYASYQSPETEYQNRLDELTQHVSRLEFERDSSAAHRAGAILAWVEALGPDGAALARAVRSRFSGQNAVAQVSGRLVNTMLEQKVDERQFMTDIILGTYTQGPAFTSGHVSFAVVPDGNSGALEVRLQGLTQCPANVAQRRQVRVHTTSTTSIAATKRVDLSETGLALAPAIAWCSTSAQIQAVQAGSRLVERIAMRRASKMLPDAEAAASRKAEAHSSAKLDERADAGLGGINDMYRGQILAPLLRQDACPQLKFWTDTQHLRLAISQHNHRQLAPAGSVPQFSDSHDLALAAHESMIENFSQSMLGGLTVRDQAWHDMLNLFTGTAPRALWVHDRAVRWSVTFDDERPLAADFSEGRMGLTLRLANVRRGDEELSVPVEIEARLIPLKAREGPAVARDGDVEIRFLESLPEEEAALWRTFLARKFQAVFPPEIHFDGLVPPAGGTLGRLRHLHLVEFDCQDGWARLCYELPEGH